MVEADNELGAPDFSAVDAVLDGSPAAVSGPVPEQGGSEQLGEAIGGISMLIFGVIAKRSGDHWALSAPEAQELGAAAAAVIHKYMPGAEASPEVRLMLVAGAIIGPRLLIGAMSKKEGGDGEKPDRSEPEKSA